MASPELNDENLILSLSKDEVSGPHASSMIADSSRP